MRCFLMIIFALSLSGISAQSNSKATTEAPDSLNATFVHNTMLNQLELAIVNGFEYVDILNVNFPTDVVMMDLQGKIVFQTHIDKKIRIEKNDLSKGYYILKTRSVKSETIKKIYL